MTEILEMVMLICFGASWPLNVMKTFRTKSTKGKSFLFLVFILIGYIAGIASKFSSESYMANISQNWYVLFFYFLNFSMVSLDATLYLFYHFKEKKEKVK